jgi:hypothetical protein
MTDDFKPGPPRFNLYIADENGQIDFRDRDRSGGLWVRERDGKKYYTGKVAGRRVMMYPVVPKDENKQEENEDW